MKDKTKKILIYTFLTVIVVFVVFVIVKQRHFRHGGNFAMKIFHLKPREIKKYILSYGPYASFAFVIIYSLKPVLLIIPVSALSVIAGGIFGSLKAFFLSMLGCFFSASFAFFLSRKLGRPFVNKLLKGKAMNLDDNLDKHGFIIMLLMRLAFIFPYDPLSYAAGLTKIKYRDFILGSLVGVMPEMIAYSVIGKSFEGHFSTKFLLPILFVAVAAPTAYIIHKKISKQ
ncbi:TVP38/TMEM64 family protein [Clostridium felsineum]|uniref:TVP38/TMEM64 family membrane protein n=1 Tax=Clostridium felsineum TaxID=36839 RepID=A0A1S8LUW5_9CLOT|nr:TVP38/TMEM64 family protein [Clostridium felsineum]MCR3758834.1 TVP38/TMEM64 family protein [Clostridium felsineum]URZ01751.1 TVP38/TMEM64 family inner membrane protein YdjZ [Clostridium felsineum]URZ05390.1 TVP38/TMEM64 family inner membrane protein YdjZ [Clostridium felsineum]URZ10431.1 TVP38/TMEM64 family inner membrane protein YdjZ [Clostridium felsineum]URZ17640.1 TVP38/TMEM64 family inner membrane protein YdjZ [Clostridium felsineum DSM 794]